MSHRAYVEGHCDDCKQRWENGDEMSIFIASNADDPKARAKELFRKRRRIDGHEPVVESVTFLGDVDAM